MNLVLTLSFGSVTALIVLLASILALYVPKVRVLWAGVATETKQLVVLVAYLGVGAFVAFAGCVAFIAALIPALVCATVPTFLTYAGSVLLAAVAGQTAFDLFPKPTDVRVAKFMRDDPQFEEGLEDAGLYNGLEIDDDEDSVGKPATEELGAP